jgi:hypothetical protein
MNDLDEFRNYRFRVPLPDGRGPMHFATHLDALTFADASMDAERIEFNSGTLENPCWEILKVCGDVVYNRPGFGVLVPYRRAKKECV